MTRTRAPGWWYPWVFVAGLFVVFVVDGVMISYAIGTFPGLQTENAYQKGITYNETLAEARAEERLGWRADVRFAEQNSEDRAGDLLVTMLDAEGRPMPALTVTAELIRPTKGGFDQHVALAYRGDGVYGATVRLPLPGQWDAHLWARADGETWQTTRRIQVP